MIYFRGKHSAQLGSYGLTGFSNHVLTFHGRHQTTEGICSILIVQWALILQLCMVAMKGTPFIYLFLQSTLRAQ